MILYSDGTKDTFVSDDKSDSKKIREEENIPLMYGGMGLLFSTLCPIPFLGLILGCIGLFKYKKNPERYSRIGKVLSIVAIIVGALISALFTAYILDPY